MAEQEHVGLLKKGAEAWNAWRHQNFGVVSRADLRGANFAGAHLAGAELDDADLRGADLAHANLQNAILIGANLAGANLSSAMCAQAKVFLTDLSGANLTRADLTGANLEGADLAGAHLEHAILSEATFFFASLEHADLTGADLRRANFGYANLAQANLTHANLTMGANFTDANLSGAKLDDVRLGATILADVDFSGTKGLDTCIHEGPSTIDHRTLQRSSQLPLSFLRGCGLPDNLIEYLPSLLNQPIQFYSCFISYSSKDDEIARRLHTDLQDKGIRCWFAPEDMKIGDRIRTRVDEVIRLHEKLLLVLSENSITSDWVEKEIETAFEKERKTKSTVLFPVRLDDAVMESETGWAADIKRTRHIGDFRCWKDHDAYTKAFERLLRDLKVMLTT